MKKFLILIGVVVLVLVFGSVYAAEKEMTWELSNGVTVFESYPAPTKVAGPELALENGVTIFEPSISIAKAEEYGASGTAAGGMAPERELYNGVTVFNPE